MKKSRTGTVCVVVVNWNRRELLRACLQSLVCQKLNHAFQVVLVDNGSTDGSAEMAEREFSHYPAFRLNVIRNSENRGFCAANNQAFAAANCEFFALLNNDAEADPGWLAALLEAFDDAPASGMAASKIVVWEDPNTIDKAGHLIYPDGQNRGRGTGEIDAGQYDRVEEALWPDGCAAMYRREMLEQIGGFDEDLFAYADDAELGLRARIAGWGCVYTPYARVRHHRGATLGLGSTRRLRLIERNRILLVVKLFPWTLICLSPFYFALRVAAGSWAAIRNKGEVSNYRGIRGKSRAALAIIQGDLEALRMIPRMLRKRKDVEKIRKLSPAEVKRLLLRFRISLKQLAEQSA